MAKDIIADSLNIDMDVEYQPFGEISEFDTDDSIVNNKLNDNSTNDYLDARKSIKQLIKTGESVIPELANLAQQSENTRAYEALASSIKTLAEMNKTLLDLTAQQKENVLSGGNSNNNNGETPATNMFIGSTEDLLNMIKKGKSDEVSM